MSIKTNKRLALGVIAALVFAPFAAIAPASAALLTSATAAQTVTVLTGVQSTLGSVVLTGFDNAVADTITVGAPTGQTGGTITIASIGGGALVAGANADVFTVGTGGTITEAAATNFGLAVDAATAKVIVGTVSRPGTYAITIGGATLNIIARSLAYTTGDGAAAAPFSTGGGVAGVANTVTVTAHSTQVASQKALVTVSGAGATIQSATNSTISADFLSAVVNAAANSPIVIKTPTAGTVTVSLFNETTAGSGLYGTTAANTVTITVSAAAVTNVYSAAKSTVLAEKAVAGTGIAVATGATATTDAAAIATPAIEAAAAANSVEVLAIQIDQLDANGNDLTTAVKNEIAITPIGRVGLDVNAPLGDYATETAQGTDFYVFADGREGVATVTVSVNGAVVKTYTVKFYGAVKSITATSKISSIDADGGAEAGVFEVLAADTAGTPIPGLTIAFGAAVDATLVATAAGAAVTDAAGKSLVTVTPVALKYGTTTVTVKVGTVFSNAITVVFAHNAIASATLAFDKTTYLPGEKAKLTMAAKDKNSLIVPDALTAATTLAFTSNLSTTTTFGTAPTFVAGAYAQDVFAPTNTTISTWNVSVKTAANAIFATAAQGVTFTATATVGIPPAPVVVPPVVYDNPTLSFVKDGGRIILSGTAVDGEGDIIIYTKKVGTTAWKERAKTLEVAAPGDFNGSIKAPKSNVLIRVKQEGTGQFSNQIIVLK